MTPSNLAIFREQYAPRLTRVVNTPDGTANVYSALAVGIIEGKSRTIPALVCEEIGTEDRWYLVTLYEGGKYAMTVAVLGCTSSEQAEEWARRQFSYEYSGILSACSLANKGGPLTASADALQEYLDSAAAGVAMLPIRSDDIAAFEGKITDRPVGWNQDILISHATLADLIHELARRDKQGMMMDAMTAADLPVLVTEIGGEVPEFDALIVDYNRLELMQERLMTAMHRAAKGMDIAPVTVQQTKPFKRNGVTNVAVMYEMNDGQTITIVFHSPDATPAKLGPRDTLTSWKWMLNKRDVTAAVAPENGQDVQLPVLAKRVMMVTAKNSARFKRTNSKKAEQMQALADTTNRIEQKTATLESINAEIESLQKQVDAGAGNGLTPYLMKMIPSGWGVSLDDDGMYSVTRFGRKYSVLNEMSRFQTAAEAVNFAIDGDKTTDAPTQSEIEWAKKNGFVQAAPSNDGRLTPDTAGNLIRGDVVRTADGKEFLALGARHDWLEVAPIVNGKAQVNNQDTFKFLLTPEKASAYPERRNEAVYPTGRNLYAEQEMAAAGNDMTKQPHLRAANSDEAEGLFTAYRINGGDISNFTAKTMDAVKQGIERYGYKDFVVVGKDKRSAVLRGGDFKAVASAIKQKSADEIGELMKLESQLKRGVGIAEYLGKDHKRVYKDSKAVAIAHVQQRLADQWDLQAAMSLPSIPEEVPGYQPQTPAKTVDSITADMMQAFAADADLKSRLDQAKSRMNVADIADQMVENWFNQNVKRFASSTDMPVADLLKLAPQFKAQAKAKLMEMAGGAGDDMQEYLSTALQDALFDTKAPDDFGAVFDPEVQNPRYLDEGKMSGFLVRQDRADAADSDLVELMLTVSSNMTGTVTPYYGKNGKPGTPVKVYGDNPSSLGDALTTAAKGLLAKSAEAPAAAGKPVSSAASKKFDRMIKVAADSVETLRPVDLDRVFDEAKSPDEMLELAKYIAAKRPELAGRVESYFADMLKEKGWNKTTGKVPTPPDSAPATEAKAVNELRKLFKVYEGAGIKTSVSTSGAVVRVSMTTTDGFALTASLLNMTGKQWVLSESGSSSPANIGEQELFGVLKGAVSWLNGNAIKIDSRLFKEDPKWSADSGTDAPWRAEIAAAGKPAASQQAASAGGPQDWHTEVPTEGLPMLPKERDNTMPGGLITARIATDAVKAITQTQKIGNVGLYAYYLPSKPNTGRHGIVRLFPDDQKPGSGWKQLDSQVFRIGMMTDSQIKERILDKLKSAQVLGYDDQPAAAPAPAAKTAANPDKTMLESIISGATSAADVDMDDLIAIAEKYGGNPDMEGLVNQALEVVTQYELEAAKAIG